MHKIIGEEHVLFLLITPALRWLAAVTFFKIPSAGNDEL
jgi:hypothetical protein